MSYFAWGGRFETTADAWAVPPDPRMIAPGEMEMHGPYETRAEADRVALEQMRKNIDICAHRMITHVVSDDPVHAAHWASIMLRIALERLGLKVVVAFGETTIGVHGVQEGDRSRIPSKWGKYPVIID